MSAEHNRRVVLVTRQTRLEELVARYQTRGQVRFYLEHLGADFSDSQREDAAYATSLRVVLETLQAWGRYQAIDRTHLSNYVLAADNIVVTLGQDGMVGNTLKYLHGQPLVVLTLRSRMPDNGVIFSDGMESDFLRFTAGMEARIGSCATQCVLVV